MRSALTSKIRSETFLWLALLLALLVALWVQGPRIGDPYAVEDDFRKFFYMHRFQEPELFRNGTFAMGGIREYQVGPWLLILNPSAPLYSLLFQAASYLMPVISFSKIIGIPLLLVSVYFLYRMGERLKGPGTGLGLALAFTILNLATPNSLIVLTGLSRSFIAPLLIALVYYLMLRKDWLAALVLVLAGLIYLPAFVLGAGTYALTLLARSKRRWIATIDSRRALPLVTAAIIVLLVQMPRVSNSVKSTKPAPASQASTSPSNVSPTASTGLAADRGVLFQKKVSELLFDPSRQAGGRNALFSLFPVVGQAGITTTIELLFYITMLSVWSLLTFWLRPASLTELPRPIKSLGLAGAICFIFAWLVIPLTNKLLLYLPSRYTQSSLFLFTLIFVVVNFEYTVQALARVFFRNRRRLIWLAIPAVVFLVTLAIFPPSGSLGIALGGNYFRLLLILLAMLLFALALLLSRDAKNSPQDTPDSQKKVTPYRRWAVLGAILFLLGLPFIGYMQQSRFYVAAEVERELFAFLESLPNDVLVAGNPCDLDSVSLFAKRMVLLSCEQPRSDSWVLETLTAYYAADPVEIASYCERYKIDYLVVNSRTFEEERLMEGNYFFEPFNSLLYPELSQRKNFVLDQIDDSAKVFSNELYSVLRCDSQAMAEALIAE